MLKNLIEALIFASGKGLSLMEIMEKLSDYAPKEIVDALDELKIDYSDEKGIVLIEFNEKFQFQSNALYGERIKEALHSLMEKELSKTLLEVLAVVAYKQPITMREIELLRGINSDYAVSTLTRIGLIYRFGTRESQIGKPIEYKTTDEFLKKFCLSSVAELPDYDDLMYKITHNFNKFSEESQSLYRDDIPEKFDGDENV